MVTDERPTIGRFERPRAELVTQEQRTRRLPPQVRCHDGAEVGRLQVRPPVPMFDPHRGGWIMPR
jgi:hypothetical protein